MLSAYTDSTELRGRGLPQRSVEALILVVKEIGGRHAPLDYRYRPRSSKP
jgi:hypothetical protein